MNRETGFALRGVARLRAKVNSNVTERIADIFRVGGLCPKRQTALELLEGDGHEGRSYGSHGLYS